MTFTLIVHVAAAPTLPAVSATVPPPAVAATFPLPHVVLALGAAAIVTPLGSASETATPVSAIAPLAVLAIEIVSTDVLPGLIVDGAKAFVSVTFGAATASVALAGAALVAPCVLVTVLGGIVFVHVPGVVPVTLTVTVQLAPAATLPAPSANCEVPGNVVTVPDPHVVDAFGDAAMTTPLGSVSLKARPVSATEPVAVLETVTVTVELPFTATDEGVKLLAIVTPGALLTTSVADAGAPLLEP